MKLVLVSEGSCTEVSGPMCFNYSLSLASRARSQVLDFGEENTALTPVALKHAALATVSPQT